MLFLVCWMAGALCLPGDLAARDRIAVVATTTTIASLVREVTGDTVDIYAVASPRRDLHFYAPTPKDVLKVKRADVLIHGGLDLELWREPLLVAAGNPRFLGSGEGSIDVSEGIQLLERPAEFSRKEGDIHQYGNPHYWVDPMNGKIMAQNVARRLGALYPELRTSMDRNLKAFEDRLNREVAVWSARMSRFKGSRVITYHRSWPYFAQRFGLEVVGELEPKPGIPPSPRHVNNLIGKMRELGVKVILQESYYERSTAKRIAKQTGVLIVSMVQAVGEMGGIGDYFAIFEHNTAELERALKTKIESEAGEPS